MAVLLENIYKLNLFILLIQKKGDSIGIALKKDKI